MGSNPQRIFNHGATVTVEPCERIEKKFKALDGSQSHKESAAEKTHNGTRVNTWNAKRKQKPLWFRLADEPVNGVEALAPASQSKFLEKLTGNTEGQSLETRGPAPERRVLVAEANRLTRDLLTLMLNQRGHHVDVADDGEQALRALRQNDYHVAFLDYDLPKLAGSRVAATIRKEANGRQVPRMIAITADLKELLTHSGGGNNLDQLLPLDIDGVGADGDDESDSEAGPEKGRVVQLRPTPAAQLVTEQHQSAFESLGYSFLTWPGDIEAGRLSARAMRASMGDLQFDGILLREQASVEKLSTIWKEPSLYTLPIIDLTGELGVVADFDGSQLAAIESGELDQVICSFRDRRAQLHRDVLLSSEIGEQLIGRAFVSNKPIAPCYGPSSKWLVSYDVALPAEIIAREADALHRRGLVQRDFFDRFHVCPRCDSRRLHVREECTECNSSDLSEGQYLHHFSCAYMGPEQDFQQGNKLICPKCSQELTHFGFDYDRPGSMVTCRSCGHASSEPAVGFVCLDCNSHIEGEAAPTSDVYAYRLTDQGLAFAKHGHSAMGTANQALRFADVPLELVAALNGAFNRFNEAQVPFALAELNYLNEKEITFQEGPRVFSSVRDLFIENMRGLLGDSGLVVKGQSRDFVLCPGIALDSAKSGLDEVLSSAQTTLRCSLGVDSQVFGPEAFA